MAPDSPLLVPVARSRSGRFFNVRPSVASPLSGSGTLWLIDSISLVISSRHLVRSGLATGVDHPLVDPSGRLYLGGGSSPANRASGLGTRGGGVSSLMA